MLFRRRQPQTFSQKLRRLLWPQRSWRRSLTYLKKRVLRLNATPHAIAAGFAAGAFASFTPFIGVHFFISFALCYLVAGNMAASAIGTTVFGNPLTYPGIWPLTWWVGTMIQNLGIPDEGPPHHLGHALLHLDFADIWTPYIEPMLIGGIPLGLAAALISYALVYFAARGFQAHRNRQIETRRASRLEGVDARHAEGAL